MKGNIYKLAMVLLTCIFPFSILWAQSPEKMSYQAVIRDASNNLVASQQIGMQISILQGSADGTDVYVETQTTTSNANGLVSIEIGGTDATVVSGDFSAIDWANSTYFIKTETDPTGGSTYTITGTSQLLSVPYALHAKTAESITGTVTESQISDLDHFTTADETDPVYTASEAANITATDISNLSNLSGTNTGDQDISGIANNATAISTIQSEQTTQDAAIALNTAKDTTGIYHANRTALDAVSGINTGDQDLSTLALKSNVLELDNTTAFTPDADYEPATKKYVDDNAPTTYSVGDFAQGGIVFWVDETGQHGLVCAKEDQSTGIQWYNGTSRYTGTTGDGLYAGSMNTTMIVATQMADNQTGNFAAKVCADYSVTVSGVTYGDWYLPSKYELNLLYLQRTAVSGFASAYYWSSTEFSSGVAWAQSFGVGDQNYGNKVFTNRVRAVRTF